MPVYRYRDPNRAVGDQSITVTGDRYTIENYNICTGGKAIRIYKKDAYGNDAQIYFSCYTDKSLIIDGVPLGGIPPDQPFDCVNGGCIPKSIYNTPGLFPNLAACQSGCAKNSNCTGECVSAEELAALQQAANQLQSKICS